ncbi:type I pullulanase [Fictibacillus fluitans]|uniref:Type I pullulanase n=1 Tax=Fictibacillus fluitans TaxID=3058422 RepID=A0ABT8I0K2_9BACL|nr:type I pullulanase [Fictibacillus sp. NE201]MDN4526560.1 type I pullulanase [Fictibacillus sp. NE201]
MDTFTMITLVIFTEVSREAQFEVTDNERGYPLKKISEQRLEDRLLFHMVLDEKIPLYRDYWVVCPDGSRIPLKTGAVVRTGEFDELYAYDKRDLGAVYSPGQTVFKLWAPTASSVRLKLFTNSSTAFEYSMNREEKGVWTAVLEGDHHLHEYTYLVRVNHSVNEAVDPYAKAVTVNGTRGVIVDMNKTHPPGWDETPDLPQINKTDSIIYELHVRDFSIHPLSGIQYKGKFKGLTESGTTVPGPYSTGLDYLTSLGITHVQILPVNDYGSIDELKADTEYNWGYDPLHFNVPEGSYATDPADPVTRIREFKSLVSALHHKGLRVIMDVVYNHVFIRETSDFEKIVPGYYFRFDYGGNPVNGTGVGNDTASERYMMRKFILDSVLFWRSEYQVDGFRFDLMGIHDIDTMNLLYTELSSIDPSIFLLGEGWKMNTWLDEDQKACIDAAVRMPGISFFNDRFRDHVKGNIFNEAQGGFINGNTAMLNGLYENVSGNSGDQGLFNTPGQSINYIECHDNHTLWDRLKILHPQEDESILRRRHLLGTALALFSQGVPFIHAGQEFFRTKQGDGNSYRSGDLINRLDWERRAKFAADVQYVQELIRIRQRHPAFRMNHPGDIAAHVSMVGDLPDGVFGVILKRVGKMDTWQDIVLFFNGHLEEKNVALPEPKKWRVVAEDMEVKEDGLYETETGKLLLPPLGFTMAVQHSL